MRRAWRVADRSVGRGSTAASLMRHDAARQRLGVDVPWYLSVVDWTLVLAIYGAVVATGSMMVAFLAHRAGGPRLVVRFEVARLLLTKFGPFVGGTVRLDNRGRSEITVASATIRSGPLLFVQLDALPTGIDRRIANGPTGVNVEFPFRLGGNSSMKIEFDVRLSEIYGINFSDRSIRRFNRIRRLRLRLDAGGKYYYKRSFRILPPKLMARYTMSALDATNRDEP